MNERDMTSHITTRPRDVPVDYGDDGAPVDTDGADSVQETLTGRPTEIVALHNYENPQDDSDDDEAARLKSLGFEYCQKCEQWKLLDKFTREPANTGRQERHSWCKACVSTYVQTVRQVVKNGKRSEGYRYKERRRKKRGRPRKSGTM